MQRVSVGRVDEPEVRLEDVPFNPAAGEAPLGEYTFVHTPQ